MKRRLVSLYVSAFAFIDGLSSGINLVMKVS